MACHIGGYDEGLTLSEVIAINHRSIVERELLEILTPQGQVGDAIQKLLAEMKVEAKIANQDTGVYAFLAACQAMSSATRMIASPRKKRANPQHPLWSIWANLPARA